MLNISVKIFHLRQNHNEQTRYMYLQRLSVLDTRLRNIQIDIKDGVVINLSTQILSSVLQDVECR